jgi:hypothetical protein
LFSQLMQDFVDYMLAVDFIREKREELIDYVGL